MLFAKAKQNRTNSKGWVHKKKKQNRSSKSSLKKQFIKNRVHEKQFLSRKKSDFWKW